MTMPAPTFSVEQVRAGIFAFKPRVRLPEGLDD